MLYTPQMVPPPRMTPSNTSPRGSLKGSPKLISPEGSPKLPPQAPTLPKVSMGSPTLPNINMDSPNFGSRSAPKTEMVSPTIPNISHSPAAPLSMPRHSPLPSHAPQLPEILPTPFPQTPYQIRTATPPEFATPTNILPPSALSIFLSLVSPRLNQDLLVTMRVPMKSLKMSSGFLGTLKTCDHRTTFMTFPLHPFYIAHSLIYCMFNYDPDDPMLNIVDVTTTVYK